MLINTFIVFLVTSNCYSIILKMVNTKFQLCGYRKSTASTPIGRHTKANWYTTHQRQNLLCRTSTANSILIGDSIIFGLLHYEAVWQRFLQSFETVNLDIGGDKTQNVLANSDQGVM